MFKYIITTRFNSDWDTVDLYGGKESWMDRRMVLFEKYTLPSIMAQTDQDFLWVINIDRATPQRYIVLFNQYAKIYPNIRYSTYIQPDIEWREQITKWIKDAEYVISTRVDNDDALSKDHVEVMKDLFLKMSIKPDYLVINPLEGYSLDHNTNKIMHDQFPRNHFLTLIEKIEPDVPIRTSSYKGHGNIPGPIIDYTASPMWIRVIHGENISNQMRGYKEAYIEDIVYRFGINNEALRPHI